jgi:hypothetical protein
MLVRSRATTTSWKTYPLCLSLRADDTFVSLSRRAVYFGGHGLRFTVDDVVECDRRVAIDVEMFNSSQFIDLRGATRK